MPPEYVTSQAQGEQTSPDRSGRSGSGETVGRFDERVVVHQERRGPTYVAPVGPYLDKGLSKLPPDLASKRVARFVPEDLEDQVTDSEGRPVRGYRRLFGPVDA